MNGAPQSCDRCPTLVASRACVVNSRGSPDAELAFVGQGPGVEENEQGKNFVGAAGHVLGALLRLSDIEPPSIATLNATRCWATGNRKPRAEEVRNCHNYLIEDLQALPNLKVVVLLGAVAVESMYGRVPLDSVAGQTLERDGFVLIPTFHPAAVLRNWDLAPLVLAHFQKAKRVAEGTQPSESLGRYETITTLGQLKALRDRFRESPIIALDTETTGVDWKDDEVLDLSFSGAYGKGYTVPILWKKAGELVPFWGKKWPRAREIIGEILASSTPKALQNASFDIRMLERSADEPHITAATSFGWHVENVQQDTMLLHKALMEYLPKSAKPNELPNMLALHTGVPNYEEEVRKQSKNKSRMEDVEPEVRWEYAAADADMVLRMLEILEPQLDKGQSWVYQNVTIPMIRCCQEMSRRGVAIERSQFDRLCGIYAEEIRKAEQEMFELAGVEFNPRSHPQVSDVLFGLLGLPKSGRKTEAAGDCAECQAGTCGEHEQIGEDALLEIQATSPHPIIPLLIKLGKMQKMKSTYLDGKEGDAGFLRHIKADGRIHGEFSVGIAETGRLAASNPNTQNPTKKPVVEGEEWGEAQAFRKCFTAREGYEVMELDWEMQELYIGAYEAEDEDVLNLLLTGRDLHIWVARNLNPQVNPELDDTEWRKVHEDLREQAKPFNFGIQYGLTVQGIMERLHCGEEQAKAFLALYFDMRPKLQEYFARHRRELIAGEDARNRFGRLRHFPQVEVLRAVRQIAGRKLQWGINAAFEGLFRERINFPTQAGGGDLNNLAHIWSEHNEAAAKKARIVLALHDSVIFEVPSPRERIIETAWFFKENWERIARDTVLYDGSLLGWEIPVSVKWGPNWGDMREGITGRGELVPATTV